LRAWLALHDAEVWDEQFHPDVLAGKLDDFCEYSALDAEGRELADRPF
jgi:hypothetical protein